MDLTTIVLCLVVGIADGDTITVRCGNSPQEKVRLAEIDAPEKRQAYGQRSKEVLSGLVYKTQVEIRPHDRDRYGRLIAHVFVGGQSVNLLMVERGMAWCYDKYLIDAPRCHRLQSNARLQRIGLWQDPGAVAPWDFRKQARKPKTTGP